MDTASMDTAPVDRVIQALLALLILGTAGAAVFGLWLVADDLSTRGEFLDGLGVAIGLAVAGVALVPFGLSAWALRASLNGSPSADHWAVAAGVAGAAFVLPFGVMSQPLLAVLLVPALLIVSALRARPRTLA